MTTRTARRWIRLVLVLTVVGLLIYGGTRWLEREVLERSEEIMRRAGGPGSMIDIAEVEITLLPGDIRWTGLKLHQQQDPSDSLSGRSLRVSGSVDEIAVRGLSLWQLLFQETLSMRSLTILNPRLLASVRTDSVAVATTEAPVPILTALNADSIAILGGMLGILRLSDSTEVRTDSLAIRITGLRSQWPVRNVIELHYGAVAGHLRGVHATLPPLYDLQIAEVDLGEDRSLRVADASIKPLKGPQHYDRVIHYETDLFNAHMDTLTVDSLDAAALINTATLSAGVMRVTGVVLEIFRDKTMPDEPFRHKPLPARLVRELPIALDMDSIVLDRWNIAYHEKNTLTPDFGEVTFNDLHATVRGLEPPDQLSGDTLVVHATTRGFDHAEVDFELRTMIGDSSDRFTATARIGRLPFTLFNRMATDLMLVRATAGTIGAVHLTMNATDDRATGRVDMEYRGLQLELLKRDGSRRPRRFLSGVVGQVVRKENLRSDPNFRHGDYEIDRRKDRSVFNYLWSGLREGMIVTALPGVVDAARTAEINIGK